MTTIARTRQWADRLQLLGWILALAGPAAGFLLAAYTPEPHRQPYVLAGILIALAGLAAGVLVGAFSQVLRALAEISEQERERSRTP